ncbi:MAG: M18 family aminopeptidase [Actinomycetes bacterium]
MRPNEPLIADFLGHLDTSVTPVHAVAHMAETLRSAGFAECHPADDWSPAAANGAGFVVRDGSLVAWVAPRSPARLGGRFIGAHTDSPGLRIRPRPDSGAAGYRQLGVEVYGSPLLASWADRDLGVAGRAFVRSGDSTVELPFRSASAQVRIPLLAIHLDREANQGLRLDPQQHVQPLWALGDPREGDFRRWLAELVDVRADDVIDWDACLFDTQPAGTLGAGDEFLVSARLDNQASCFAAIRSIVDDPHAETDRLAVVALFDHEEVGSVSATGADGAWFAQVLERRAECAGITRAEWLRELSDSLMISADMAHGVHPNYPERHEPQHRVRLGGGMVVKRNENQRYATSGRSAAAFAAACERVGVEVQQYSHHGALPCGSTIGPLVASQIAVDTVDVGAAQLSMHSVREVMAVSDLPRMVTSFGAWLA